MTHTRIPVVMISDDNFIMQTSVTITSLYKNKYADTVYEIFIVMAECSKESALLLQEKKKFYHILCRCQIQ